MAIHPYTLRMKSCPWCLEPLPRRFTEASCPRCGRSLGEEAEPEALDLRYQRVEGRQQEAFRRMLAFGTPVVAALGLLMPLLHAGVLAVVPLLVASHLVVTRVALVREAQRMLGPVRRLLNRWLARFSFLWIGLPGYGAMAVPLVGALVGAGTFALLTSAVHVSTLVSLDRERRGRELAAWEKALPTVLALITVVLLALVLLAALGFGWSVMAIVERLRST